MTIPAVILASQPATTSLLVGGIPLLIRHIKELYKLTVREFYLVGVSQLPRARHSRLPTDVVLHMLPAWEEDLPQQLHTVGAAHGELLLVRGECVIDPRLCRELLTRSLPHWLAAPGHQAGSLPAAARLSVAALAHWGQAGQPPWPQALPELVPSSLDEYNPSARGPVPFYLDVIATPAEAVRATHTLIRLAQKRALDLPALLLDPWCENRLVSALCNSLITPNQVSLFTGLVGFGIAWLFLHGWLRVGISLAYVVEVLDGVDGKLARTRVQTSRLGELEHMLDFCVEHAWYLTITIFLATSTHESQLWWIGGGLMACDLLDNLLYALGQTWFHKQIDELSTFDRAFRLIAGRRNIYAWMCFFGFWAGAPVAIFTAAFVWAAVTVAVHLGSLLYQRYRWLAVA